MTRSAIDRAALDRLAALGASRGGLTTADLREALPVDGMEPEDIALVVAHLEDRGVPVELEDELIGGPPGAPAALPVIELRGAEPASPPASMTSKTTSVAASAGAPRTRPGLEPPAVAHRAVALAGLLVLLLLGVGLAVLA